MPNRKVISKSYDLILSPPGIKLGEIYDNAIRKEIKQFLNNNIEILLEEDKRKEKENA